MNNGLPQKEYIVLLNQIKQRIQIAQKRAIFSASGEMLRMYWDIGGMLQSHCEQADGETRSLKNYLLI